MRICSRCNNEVKKTDLVCSRCGFSLVKDEYGKRVDHNTTYNIDPNSETGKKMMNLFNFDGPNVNRKALSIRPANNILGITVFVIVMFLMLMPAITFSILSNKTTTKIEDSLVDMDKMNSYLDDVTLIAKDYYIAWTSILDNKDITLGEVSEKISLTEEEMSNDNCKTFISSNLETDLLSCIMKSHENKGTYKKTDSDMIELYSFVDSFKDIDVRKVLVDIYGYAYELYYLPDSTTDYNQYKSYYYNYTNNINKLLNIIKPDNN